MKLNRRTTLTLALAGLAGAVLPLALRGRRNCPRHIIPSATPTSVAVSVSLEHPATGVYLMVDDRKIIGEQKDTDGRFYGFQAEGLRPDTLHRLELGDEDGAIDEPWQLKTLPDPESAPEKLRIVTYTCAGGADGFGMGKKQFFKPHAFRQKLFDEALEQNPDLVVAIGDHIYWDLRGGAFPPVGRAKGLIKVVAGWYLKFRYGAFDRARDIIGTDNEVVLTRIGDEQIADLYGTRFKSVPMVFISDDHDYFENDDADENLVTFPPDAFSAKARRAMAQLYYPPLTGGPSAEMDRAFGALRYGTLFEAPLFDCAGYLSYEGEGAGLVPREIESWLVSRAENSPCHHFAFIPSHPMGWTAGKWREWYPDVVAPEGFTGVVSNLVLDDTVEGTLTAGAQKYLWPKAWWEQHQRLLMALAARPGKRFMFSGDIHAQGAIRIAKSGDEDLGERPVDSILVGPVGTSDATWPSAARGITAAQPAWLSADMVVPTVEVNGFCVLDITLDGIGVRLMNCGGFDRDLGEDGRVLKATEFTISG